MQRTREVDRWVGIVEVVGPDGVDDQPAARKIEAGRGERLAYPQGGETAGIGLEPGAGRRMDRAAHATASHQAGVGGVDDAVAVGLSDDIAVDDGDEGAGHEKLRSRSPSAARSRSRFRRSGTTARGATVTRAAPLACANP